MADIGIRLDADVLVLWRGRDFKWSFENLDLNGQPTPYPPGRLYFEFQTAPVVTEWEFEISGSVADLKVEHDTVTALPDKTLWQLVFLPDGEEEGGDPLGRGKVQKVG